MSADNTANLIYLVLLGCAVGGWFLVQNRDGIGKMMQQALIWGFIFLGVVAGYGLWNDVQRQTTHNQMLTHSDGQISVPRQPDGHYYLTLELNGANIRFVVDTGATDMVLTRDDAARAGIDPDSLVFLGTANTANGQVRTAPVRINTVRLGDITDTDVRASVNGGQMQGSLLGMGYLEKWGRIEISGGELRLTR
ncbi:retropepsin-like aspartic protease family protein [Sulfitobacter donghicola]|uniref:Aspartyl protease n=1 Tax=Sulfitobacter donghicola DSW-25 = KCTC 12864 = JCM 14565 TaxID=1300350 RepID=A0A073IW59_9RHOB|nr:TIGR02281 family clan AA aspartic protease [Sulfitobacter donghicola]KEJ89597.1 aspartyl protease [Sulfitobacter donghicola DSW-25 = KCTC 12864 = JCM 14565]KIN69434.1 Retroviral aspartyl protease family protein [Sulfitobacter donghicola DSW-25 = KCTC 12864 = JCM 14565]